MPDNFPGNRKRITGRSDVRIGYRNASARLFVKHDTPHFLHAEADENFSSGVAWQAPVSR